MNNQQFRDQDIMADLLSSQKYITENYNTYANECVTPTVLTSFMNILKEEHQIQNQVFSEMQNRGWYAPEAADQNKVTQAKQKFMPAQ